MKATLFELQENEWVSTQSDAYTEAEMAQLVMCFSSKKRLKDPELYQKVRREFPIAAISFCSTAGEIIQNRVFDHSFVAIALQFNHATIKTAAANISQFNSSYEIGVDLVKKLPSENLKHVLVFSDGSKVNGSELVKGLRASVNEGVSITGGLAGDGDAFESTLVGLNGQPREGEIIVIGFYGEHLVVTTGSQGGWDPFGTERTVTKSDRNILYEIDNKNALELYKKYLGPDVEYLPGSALLFPLAITLKDTEQPVGRTILSINDQAGSMTFAGDIPEGAKVRFMKANFDKLTSAASKAAVATIKNENFKPAFSLLVSCVGRKLILANRIDEEVEAVEDVLGKETVVAGFYSYGEIAPFNEGGVCQLHNQTMTITSFYEHA